MYREVPAHFPPRRLDHQTGAPHEQIDHQPVGRGVRSGPSTARPRRPRRPWPRSAAFGPGWGGPMSGPPPWVAQMFGPQWGGPGGNRGGRGRARVRRGDVRSAILDVLANAGEPINGYQVIQQIAERSQGAW